MRRDVLCLVVLTLAAVPAVMARPQHFTYSSQAAHHWKLTDLTYLNALRNLRGSFQTTASPVVSQPQPQPTPQVVAQVVQQTNTNFRRPENIQAIIDGVNSPRPTPAARPVTQVVSAFNTGSGTVLNGQVAGSGQTVIVGPTTNFQNRPVAVQQQQTVQIRVLPQQNAQILTPALRQQPPTSASGVGGGSANNNRVTGVGTATSSAQNGGIGVASGQGAGVLRPTGSSATGNSGSFTQGTPNRPTTGTQGTVLAPVAAPVQSGFRPSLPVPVSNANAGGVGSAGNGQVTALGTSSANAQNGGVAISSGQGSGVSSPSGSSAGGNAQSISLGSGLGAGDSTPFTPSGQFRPSQPIFFGSSDALGAGTGSAGNGQASALGTASSTAQNGGVGFASGQGSAVSTPSGSSASGTGNSIAAGSPIIVGSPAPSGGAVPQNSAPSVNQVIQDTTNNVVLNTNTALLQLIKAIFSGVGSGITPVFGNLVFGNGQVFNIGGLLQLEPMGSLNNATNNVPAQNVNNGDSQLSGSQTRPTVSGVPQNSIIPAETTTIRPVQQSSANAVGAGAGTAGNGQASGTGVAVASAQNGGVGIASGQGSGISTPTGSSSTGTGNSVATGTQNNPTAAAAPSLPPQSPSAGSSTSLGVGAGTASNGQVTGTGIAVSSAQNGGVGVSSGQGTGTSSPSGSSASGSGNSVALSSRASDLALRVSSTAPPFAITAPETTLTPPTTTPIPAGSVQGSTPETLRGFAGSASASANSDGTNQVAAASGPVSVIPSEGITIPASLSSALTAFFGNLIKQQSLSSAPGFSPRITEELQVSD